MKKVTYQYGCRALGYTDGEFFVDEGMTDADIQEKIERKAGFSITFYTEDGYEPQTEIVFRKSR